MKITNKYGLPRPLVSMLTKEHYSKEGSQYSMTELIGAPKIARLREEYEHLMEQDVTERMYSFLGTALHARLEEVGAIEDHTLEERLHVDVDGVKISGAIDVQERVPAGTIIWDYKVTSVWSVMNQKDEWVQQLNMYKWLVEKVKHERVVALRICAFLRDWSNHGNGDDYPKAPIVTVDLPVWSSVETEKFVRERIALHQESRMQKEFKEEYKPCTDKDRWMSETKYAVKREGRKSAIRVFDNLDEANDLILTSEPKGFIEERGGEPRRCAGNYCGVASVCKQYQKELEAK